MSKASLWVASTYLPFSGQSKKLASNAVADIIKKCSLLTCMKWDGKKYDAKLDNALQTGSAINITAVQLDLVGAEAQIAELQSAIQHQGNCLGLTGQAKLKELKDSKYLQLHVSATIL